jgi:hypothetical protein
MPSLDMAGDFDELNVSQSLEPCNSIRKKGIADSVLRAWPESSADKPLRDELSRFLRSCRFNLPIARP